jgi:plasmid stabilization system protein ParE
MPRRGWSDKDERMYEHIKDAQAERNVDEDRAEEIAARTVNKQRREEGRTPNVRTQGAGNPNTSYEARTKDELENIARERGIDDYSRLSKEELIEALRS